MHPVDDVESALLAFGPVHRREVDQEAEIELVLEVAARVEELEWDYASMDGLTRLNQSLPDPGAGFSVRWAGFFTPPQAAAYTFSFVLGESLDLDFNNELVTSVNERVKVRLMPAHLPVANPPSIAKRGAR